MKTILLILFSLSLSQANPLNPRIVGGDFAKENQFPHQIALYKNGAFRCGGSIYNENWIITAAHCVENGNGVETGLSIRAGSLSKKSGGVSRKVVKSIFHEKYGNFENDIALMKLDKPLKFNDAIKPIEIETKELSAGTILTISGWGTEVTGGTTPTFLKFNDLKINNGKQCGCPAKSPLCYKGVLCLGKNSVNNGACNGDSGGPAIANGKLVGVANFVVGGCGSMNPDGYAKVSYFKDWIENTVNEKIQSSSESSPSISSSISFL